MSANVGLREPDADHTEVQRVVAAIDVQTVRFKRQFDLVAGVVLSVLTLPVQAIALAVSAISFRANPIFRQTRIGMHGEPFTFVKVRSLPVTAPSEAAKHDLEEVQNSAVGSFLRKTHFDETIQFWLVATGKLSLVGPRPEMVGLTDSYDPEFVRNRTSVRPGITGLWQVSEASHGLIGDAPEYDEYYVTHRTWSLELWVMWRTVLKMLRGRTITFDDLR